MILKSHFSSTLSSLRREKGLSQRQAAADLGVSQALLSHYENGAREPKLEFVVRACDYYNVAADDLLGRVNETAAVPPPFPGSNDSVSRLAAAVLAVFDKIDERSEPELHAAAVDYLTIPAENLVTLLSAPDAPHDPMRDVALKLAEAEVIKNVRGRDGVVVVSD